MRFLWAGGGDLPDGFAGVLATPAMLGIPASIVSGSLWAADNEAFTRGFDPGRFFSWLDTMSPYRARCLFLTVPDVVGDAAATLASWHKWRPAFGDWPCAFVAQDGSKPADIPADAATLFVGGSTDWKESADAVKMIRAGQERGLHIHIGRVNWGRRYRMFRVLPGAEEFTCDGTRQRFEGRKKTVSGWRGYMDQPPLLGLC